jgi:predicted RNA-binding protein with PIN domain
MQWRLDPGFLGSTRLRVGLPQLPAALEAAAVVAAVMGFGLGWAWLARPAPPTGTAYPVVAMSTPEPDSTPEGPVEEWLVDGFNLLHTVILGGEERGRWWTATGRSRVLEAVASATREHERTRVWVVFDGSRPALAPPEAEAGRLQSIFAPSADDWLVARVRSAERPDRVVVVTADRRLAGRARHHGATVLAPRDFLARQA